MHKNNFLYIFIVLLTIIISSLSYIGFNYISNTKEGPFIIGLNIPFSSEELIANEKEVRQRIRNAQDDFMKKYGGKVKLKAKYNYIPSMAISIKLSDLEYIKSLPEVKYIHEDRVGGFN